MKKTVLGLIFFIIATLSVSAQYFDFELGLGGGWRKYNYNQVYNDGDFPLIESHGVFRMDIGLRGGFGPLGNIPVYLVAEAEWGIDTEEGEGDYGGIFSGFIGAGVIFYPKPNFQLGMSLGALWKPFELPYDEEGRRTDDSSTVDRSAGFAWNISAAIDGLDFDDWGLLVGLKYSGAIHNFNYSYSFKENSSYNRPPALGNGNGTRLTSDFTVFMRVAYRKISRKEIDAARTAYEVGRPEREEREKFERERREKQRRERLVAEERQRQLSALEMEEIRRQVREELQSAYPGIDGAIGRAGQKLINGLPEKTRVAVINILSNNGEMSAYVAEELEYQLVSSGKFTMVDRNRLATIRAEQNFQMSGHVSDESAVGIGQMLGANIVLTGSISGVGSSQRLSISALNVRTGEIILMVREEF